MSTDLHTERCVACGKFMNCEEVDARNHFEPDSHFGPEVSEWTCGPCTDAAAEGLSEQELEEIEDELAYLLDDASPIDEHSDGMGFIRRHGRELLAEVRRLRRALQGGGA